MLRNTVLTAALALATFTGLAAVPSANAQPPFRHDNGHGRPGYFARYEVLVRDCGRWECRGTYRDRDDARQAAHHLRMRGFDVRVERN